VAALSKSHKPLDDPKSYRPNSLLCIPYKILEQMFLARLGPLVVDSQLPEEQAGFDKDIIPFSKKKSSCPVMLKIASRR